MNRNRPNTKLDQTNDHVDVELVLETVEPVLEENVRFLGRQEVGFRDLLPHQRHRWRSLSLSLSRYANILLDFFSGRMEYMLGLGAFPVRLEREREILCDLYFGDRRQISLIIKGEFHFDPCSLGHMQMGLKISYYSQDL